MLKRILPHVNIIISMIIVVLFALNRINEAMGFLRGSEFEFLLIVLCITSMITSVMLICRNRKNTET